MFYAISGTRNGTRNALIHSFNDAFIYLFSTICVSKGIVPVFGALFQFWRKEDMPDLYNCGVKIRKE